VSSRRRPRDTALTDQYDAAARHLDDNITTLLPHADRGQMTHQLRERLLAALKVATADPRRCCPHVDGERPAPLVLDLWRGLLSCGACRHLEQTRRLDGDEEHRCDQCHDLMADDDMRLVVLRFSVVTAGAMVCPTCYQLITAERGQAGDA